MPARTATGDHLSRYFGQFAASRLDPQGIKAVDLDDLLLTNEVEIFASGGLSALRPSDTHDIDEAPAVDYTVAWSDTVGDRHLSLGTRPERFIHVHSVVNGTDITPIASVITAASTEARKSSRGAGHNVAPTSPWAPVDALYRSVLWALR